MGRARRLHARPHPAVPHRRAGRLAVPVREPGPGRRAPGVRQRLDGEHRRPAPRDGGGIPPGDRGAEPFLPCERLDLAAALDAFTTGSAHALRLERQTGSIEPGKLADLAVLDRDPFAPGAGPVGDARVLATLVEGEPVWADPVLGW
ncbi:MAG TPA: amidohydrolase family protein [Actinomycetes bacterium]|nr:amidohydrolase family protein [Actinomycetes bacterium]